MTASLVLISQIIKSYPDIENHIMIHLIKNNRKNHPDFLSSISNNHQNTFITTCSDDYELTYDLIIDPNLNVSFEGNLNMEQYRFKYMPILYSNQSNKYVEKYK